MQTQSNEQQKPFKQTQETKKFFEKLNKIKMNISEKTKNDLEFAANFGVYWSFIDLSPENLVKHIFTPNAVQVEEDFKDAFKKLRLKAKKLFPLSFLENQGGQLEDNQDRQQLENNRHHLNIETAIRYIRDYLSCYTTDEHIDNTNNHFHKYYNAMQSSEQRIITEKIIKVMKKLGENRLEDLRDHPDKIGNISRLEKIGHYINKAIRAATFGLAGYEFSDKEAQEALNDEFDSDYYPTQKSLFSDNNTRFAQVVKERLIREAAADNGL